MILKYNFVRFNVENDEEEGDQDEIVNLSCRLVELKPISPIVAALCFDDVEVFARLHAKHRLLFGYFRPCEHVELVYNAVQFESKQCLAYLLNMIANEIQLGQNTSSEMMISNDRFFALISQHGAKNGNNNSDATTNLMGKLDLKICYKTYTVLFTN